jgi:hypothetical protein
MSIKRTLSIKILQVDNPEEEDFLDINASSKSYGKRLSR